MEIVIWIATFPLFILLISRFSRLIPKQYFTIIGGFAVIFLILKAVCSIFTFWIAGASPYIISLFVLAIILLALLFWRFLGKSIPKQYLTILGGLGVAGGLAYLATLFIQMIQESSGISYWQWFSELIIPASIPVSIAIWGWKDQQEKEKNLIENNRSAALQSYIDFIAGILLGEKIVSPVSNSVLSDTALDVIRIRTLSLLRELGPDGERKGEIVIFLYDTKLIIYQIEQKQKKKIEDILRRADLNYVNLNQAALDGAVISNAQLKHAELAGVSFYRAVLKNSDLSHSNFNLGFEDIYWLSKSIPNLSANLKEVDFSGAKLYWANLRGADLRKANLYKTDLTGAYLGDADLREANLRDAVLESSILLATDLRNSKGLIPEQLQGDRPPLLCNVALPSHITGINPNRDCDRLTQILKEQYKWFPAVAQQIFDDARKKKWD